MAKLLENAHPCKMSEFFLCRYIPPPYVALVSKEYIASLVRAFVRRKGKM